MGILIWATKQENQQNENAVERYDIAKRIPQKKPRRNDRLDMRNGKRNTGAIEVKSKRKQPRERIPDQSKRKCCETEDKR